MKQHLETITKKLIAFLSLQLFLSLVSLPILACWGLPISLMSPVGNFIFSPFLTLFLLLSSLIFFCELFFIPNGIFIYALELISCLWQWCLSHTYGSVLIACKKPAVWICISMVLITFLIIRHRALTTPLKRLCGLTILFIAYWLFLNAPTAPVSRINKIPCNGGVLTYIHDKNYSVLYDPGVLGKRLSSPSWVSYTLVPEIIGMTGDTSIDHVIITKPGILVYESIAMLCTKLRIGQITMPWLDGNMDEPLKRSFNRLYARLKNQGCIIRSFHKKPMSIKLDARSSIEIVPQQTLKTYRTIQYPECSVTSIIDNESVTLYDSK